MTPAEYNLRMTAAKLKQIDELETMAHAAYFHRVAQAYDKDGKYIAKTPKDIYDADKAEKVVLGKLDDHDRRFDELYKTARRLQAYRLSKQGKQGGLQ